MCYYRAGLCAEIQGKEIHLVLLHRIGYWDRMSNLYATDNKVNVNQSNMKLKYILNGHYKIFCVNGKYGIQV